MPYLAIPSPPLAIPPLQVHELLRGAFRELRVIYANYSVDDGDGTDDVADPTLGPSEWQALMLDCRVAALENCFPMIPSGKAHNEMLLPEQANDEATARAFAGGKALV